MNNSYLYDIPEIDHHLRRDNQGDGLYLVGLVDDAELEQQDSPTFQMFSRGVAVAVVEASSGLVLAWDGWYAYDETTLPAKARPTLVPALEKLSGWEGDPQLGLLSANLVWLGTEVGRQLLSWCNSPSATAARLIASGSGDVQPLHKGQVAAALPLHAEDLTSTVARCNSDIASHYPTWPSRLSPEIQQACADLGIRSVVQGT